MNNTECRDLCKKYLPSSIVSHAFNGRTSHENQLRILLEQGKIPLEGWEESTVELVIQELSLMDSNNYLESCGAGEREARIVSTLVAKRHYRMGHGIGRSGDIAAAQPKAVGSSLLAKLTNSMALHSIKLTGIKSTKACAVIPVATGMALTLCMLTLRKSRPNAKYVIWPRIDQKSCFKSISTAGYIPIIVQPCIQADSLTTNLAQVEIEISKVGSDSVLCILATTSCFAPRTPDAIIDCSRICHMSDIPLVVNNAYGLQSSKCCHLVEEACRKWRLDYFVQSTDKNYMVPVGGSIVASPEEEKITSLCKMYPGRANASPITDLFITLLSVGTSDFLKLIKRRREIFFYLHEKLSGVAEKFGERVLCTRKNDISMAMTLSKLGEQATFLGSMLFHRCVSGARVVSTVESAEIEDVTFQGFGSHCNNYPHGAYLNCAAAIGMTNYEVDSFIRRLDKCLTKLMSEIEVATVVTNEGEGSGIPCE